MKSSQAEHENSLLKTQSEQMQQTVKALYDQISEFRSKHDRLELQVASSIPKTQFMALENDQKSK